MPRISVVIPIWNAGDRVRASLESLKSQTLTDFEAICVDDASVDESASIVEEYASADPRFRLIRHTDQKGPGGARNTGIRAARSACLAGLDSDDRMHADMLETLWEASEGGGVDIVTCGFNRVDEAGEITLRRNYPPRDFDLERERVDIFSVLTPAFWNKLWRRSLFVDNDIWFPERIWHQDLATIPRIVASAQRIRQIDKRLYDYTSRPNSITLSNSERKISDYISVFQILDDFVSKLEHSEFYERDFRAMVQRNMRYHAQNAIRIGETETGATTREYLGHLLSVRNGYLAARGTCAGETSEDILAEFGIPDARPTRMQTKKIMDEFSVNFRARRRNKAVALYDDITGRRLIRKHRQFDDNWYRTSYRDLESISYPLIDHYLRYGAVEGRDPNPEFSTAGYLIGDRSALKSGENPLVRHIRSKSA